MGLIEQLRNKWEILEAKQKFRGNLKPRRFYFRVRLLFLFSGSKSGSNYSATVFSIELPAESSSEMEDAHSPTIPQSSPPPQHLLSTIPNANIATTTVENAASWIDDAMRQALVYQNTIVEKLDSTIGASRARLSQILDTSVAHTSQTFVSESEN